MSGKAETGGRPDLANLVLNAGDELAKQRTMLPDAPKPSRWVRPIASLVVAGAIALSAYVLSPWLVGYSESAIRDGLIAAAQVARKEVEDYRGSAGSLPERLPNAALAMVVEYAREGAGYRLRATDGNLFVVVDDRGAVIESGKR